LPEIPAATDQPLQLRKIAPVYSTLPNGIKDGDSAERLKNGEMA